MIYEPCLLLKPENIRIADSARVDSFCKLEGGQGLTIGEHVHIASFSHLNVGGGELVLGDHSGCSSHVVICSGVPDIRYLHVSAADLLEHQHPIRMKTVIGRYAVVFAGSVVYPGVTIGDGAMIGAGSVVTKDVPAWEVWGGCPAHKLRSRPMGELLDVDEYWALAVGAMAR